MIFHIAQAARWAEAQRTGRYTASTLGRELDEVGFIHLSTAEQLPGVAAAFYRGVPDLVLLHVDESMLTAELRWEEVPGAAAPFPHLYGPLDVAAVVQAEPFTA